MQGKHVMKKAPRNRIVLRIAGVVLLCLIAVLLIYGNTKSSSRTESLKQHKNISSIRDSREIVCWGDSLTEGVGASFALIKTDTGYFDASFLSYPEILEQLTGIRTYNFGMSGATSADIAFMQGGYTLDEDSEEQPESEDRPEGEAKDKPKDGHEGESGDKPKDRPEGDGFEFNLVKSMIKLQAAEHKGDILILEMGSNGGWDEGFEQLIEQYRFMIDYAGCDKFIIIGDTDDPGSSYADPWDYPQDYGLGIQETAWEAALREEFGEHFINMRLFLIERGLSEAGLEPTEEDEEYAEQGWISEQLRYDWTHLNSYGYYAQAIGVYEKGKALGYWT